MKTLVEQALEVTATPEVEAFLDAWRQWNSQPSYRPYVVAMEETAAPLAERVGVSVMEFRRRVCATASAQLARGKHTFNPRLVVFEILGHTTDLNGPGR